MIVIYNTETSIITRLIDLQDKSEQNIAKFLNENEDYKSYSFRNDLSTGQNINKFNDEGRLRPNSELVAMELITLTEDEILEDEVIRSLTEDELREKHPERFTMNLSQETTVVELIAQKDKELATLKDQYLDADLDDNEALKTELKAKVQDIKKELILLKENVDKG